MMRSAKVRDFMADELVTLASEMDIHRAIQILLEKDISGAPVLDAEGALVGVLAIKDCLRIAYSTSYHREKGGPVAEFMSTDVETLDPDCDIVAAAGTFLESRYRRFPVVKDGRLVGQISRYDVLRALAELW